VSNRWCVVQSFSQANDEGGHLSTRVRGEIFGRLPNFLVGHPLEPARFVSAIPASAGLAATVGRYIEFASSTTAPAPPVPPMRPRAAAAGRLLPEPGMLEAEEQPGRDPLANGASISSASSRFWSNCPSGSHAQRMQIRRRQPGRLSPLQQMIVEPVL
jgi:hypothetical protein